MFNGERVVGQIGIHGPWFEIGNGGRVRFNRHGSFTFSKKFGKFAHLTIRIPRKGWNPNGAQTKVVKLQIGVRLTVARTTYHLAQMYEHELSRFGKPYPHSHAAFRRQAVAAKQNT
jgi:hypothetical protein